METRHRQIEKSLADRATRSRNPTRSVVADGSLDGSVMANTPAAVATTEADENAATNLGKGDPENDKRVNGQREQSSEERHLGGLGSQAKQQTPVCQVRGREVDLRQLRPSELTRMLNSTPLNEVISERQLYRHRQRAGFKIGDGKRVDIFRYVAWLFWIRHTPHPPSSVLDERVSVRMAQHRKTSVTEREVLELLERQDYRCALTGRKLEPDSSALDHILAVSRGGEHCIANAQVLHREVNQAKGTMTNEEFIQLCREVVVHVDQQTQSRRYSV
ncbi:MAG: hypothetical protein H8E66_00615 [Planctomycetes bacterium]|nr:hypothetical protein [Planctomycetota bacterium]